jgi:alpha-L-rhamnosidase
MELNTEKKTSLDIVALSCEYLDNPIGIDIKHPRLSWNILSDERGQTQTAYQILVSTTLENLQNDQGDLWNSGRVASDQSIHVAYNGVILESGMRCWWKVRVWDMDGNPSAYSAPSYWQMGLLDEADWRAEWIALDIEAATGMQMKSCSYLRKEFQLPGAIQNATAYVTAKGVYELRINGQRVGDAVLTPGFTDYRQRIQYQAYDVTQLLNSGYNAVGAVLGEGWYSGHIGMRAKRNYYGTFPQFLLQVEITFADGAQKILVSDGSWKGATGALQYSDMLLGEFYDARLEEAEWDQAGYDDKAWRKVHVMSPAIGKSEQNPDHPMQIVAETKPLSIISPAEGVYVYEMDRTITGWVRLCLGGEFGQKVRLRYAQMIDTADYENIYTENLTSPEWVTSFELKGEQPQIYENREIVHRFRYIEITGLSTAPEIEAITACVVNSEAQSPQLVAQRSYPIRITQEIQPIALRQLDTDKFIFDLGQNMVGWVRLFLEGPTGTRVQVRHGEKLHEDGTLYTENLRYAKATDTYILAGNGPEIFEPHFTFHGFRFVEVEGFPGTPNLESLVGCVVHNDMPQTGEFVCSNELINQLWKNIVWTQRGNSISVPTDCPQRDERLGWLGDATRFLLTACHNMQAGAFYTKWMDDIVAAQSSQGAFSEVAPRIVTTRDGAPGYGDSAILVPWSIYHMYGDRRIIEDNFEAMQAMMRYIQKANPDYLWTKRVNANYGDWVSYYASTPFDLFDTALWALDALLMAEMSNVIGQHTLSQEYKDLYEKIKNAFIEAFVHKDGKLEGDTQTGYALALAIGLVPDHMRCSSVKALADNIAQRDGHLSTGVSGTAYLGPVLAQSGRMDVLYQLLTNETCPSWGYWIKQGATTIWERWDAISQIGVFEDTKESSFYHYKFKARAGMNSFNHPALGSIGECLYRYVAGIDFDHKIPGFKSFHIHPIPDGNLRYAKAKVQSMYGQILSEWRIEDDTFQLHVIIPPNTYATITLPWENPDDVREGETPLGNVQGVKMIYRDRNVAVFSVGSGDYVFTCPYHYEGTAKHSL